MGLRAFSAAASHCSAFLSPVHLALQVGINAVGVAMSATESFGNSRKALAAGECIASLD